MIRLCNMKMLWDSIDGGDTMVSFRRRASARAVCSLSRHWEEQGKPHASCDYCAHGGDERHGEQQSQTCTSYLLSLILGACFVSQVIFTWDGVELSQLVSSQAEFSLQTGSSPLTLQKRKRKTPVLQRWKWYPHLTKKHIWKPQTTKWGKKNKTKTKQKWNKTAHIKTKMTLVACKGHKCQNCSNFYLPSPQIRRATI